MIIKLICFAESADKVKQLCKESYRDTEFIEIKNGDDLSRTVADMVIVQHEIVSSLKGITIPTSEKLIIYYKNKLVEADDPTVLEQLLEQYVSNGELRAAKSVNDILIDIDFLNHNAVALGSPDYLQIETTNICNAKCIMCSHYFSDNKCGAYLDTDVVKKTERSLSLCRTISLNGMGEPFISPRVCEQIDYYCMLGNKIVTNTNLSKLSDKLIQQIRDHFEWLEISCDGATKETYESIRKNLKFEVIIENLEILKSKCPDVRKHIATVIMRQNVMEMPKMVELAAKYGASVITFMTLNSNIIINNSKDEMNSYPLVLEYYSVKALEKGEQLGIPVIVPNAHMLNKKIRFEDIEEQLVEMQSIPMYKSDLEEKKMKEVADKVDSYLEVNDEIQRDTVPSNVNCRGICDWILKQGYIDLNGNVAMCCRNQSFHIGNIVDMGSHTAVWNSKFYVKLREMFYSGKLPEACLKCGLIESGNLKYLDVDITPEFYYDPQYKVRQKETLRNMIQGE